MKSKAEITAEALRNAIEDGKPTSMTKLAHHLGYRGSVSSSLTKKFRQLIPEIDALLKAAEPKARKAMPAKPATGKANPPSKPIVKPGAKGAKAGKWPRDPRNPFREGSYGTCFDILAAPAHKNGLPRERLVALLAEATGKDLKRSGFDAQVVCSARGAAGEGLNPFEGPRNRSARFGYWVERKGDNVRLVLPERGSAKEAP